MPADRELTRSDRRRLAALGLPTLGLALSITVVSTYLPTVARQYTHSTTVIGLIIGGEGLGALLLPVAVGVWSDRLDTRWGGRLPFIVAGTPVVVIGLVLMGLVGSLGGIVASVGIFFIGYFVAYEPYRALYPDLIDEEIAARGQSAQAVARGAGTGLALLGGGLLLAQSRVAPFAVAAGIVLVAIAAFSWLLARDGRPDQNENSDGVRETLHQLAGLLRDTPALRAFFVANALWELALAALKTFVILWLTRGLGQSLSTSALMVGAGALLILGGAAVSGKLAERHGRRRIMFLAVVSFGAPMVVPLVTVSHPLIIMALPFITVGGGVLMSLPYALLQPLMPKEHHGALTGFYSVSRGVGLVLGPLLGGVAVQSAGGILSSTEGYAAVWGVCGLATLASLPLISRIGDDEHD